MKSRDHSAAVGLCASLVMHAGVVAALLVFYVKDMDARRWWEEGADAQRGRAEAVVRPEADRMVWRDGEFGETKGAGEALNSLEGVEKYLGRLGPQDQAPLSRDPVGNGKLADEPQNVTALKEQAAATLPPSIAARDGASAPFGVGNAGQEARPKVVVKPPMKVIAIEEKGVAVAEADQVPVEDSPAEKAPHPALASEYRGEGKSEDSRGAVAVGELGAAGDPAPMSESESDAFSRIGAIGMEKSRRGWGGVLSRSGRG